MKNIDRNFLYQMIAIFPLAAIIGSLLTAFKVNDYVMCFIIIPLLAIQAFCLIKVIKAYLPKKGISFIKKWFNKKFCRHKYRTEMYRCYQDRYTEEICNACGKIIYSDFP